MKTIALIGALLLSGPLVLHAAETPAPDACSEKCHEERQKLIAALVDDLTNCVREKSVQFTSSGEPAETIIRAATLSCDDPINTFRRASEGKYPDWATANSIKVAKGLAHDQVLPYIVQYRAAAHSLHK